MNMLQSNVLHQAVLVEFDTPPALAGLLRRRSIALLSVGEQTIAEHWARHLHEAGVETLLVVGSRFPQQLRDVFGNGERWGFTRIDYLVTGSLNSWDEVRALTPGLDLDAVHRVDLATMPATDKPPLSNVVEYWRLNMDYLAMSSGYRAPGVGVHAEARVDGSCRIGRDVLIARGATVSNSVIAGLADVGEDTVIRDSVVLFDSWVGTQLNLDQVVVDGNYVFDIKRGTELLLNDPALLATIRHEGERVTVGERALAMVLWVLTLPVALLTKDADEQSCRSRLPRLTGVIAGERPLWGRRNLQADDRLQLQTAKRPQPGVICLADFAGEDALAQALADNFPVSALDVGMRVALVVRWVALVFKSGRKQTD